VVRVAVIGPSGAGKSRLARAAAQQLGVPHVELDAIFHQPGWTSPYDEEFRALVRPLVAGDAWVVDGNYGAVRPLVLARADVVVWLDYERSLVMRRVITRSARRAITREELWNGNRETVRSWVRPDHPIRWSWSQHARKRRNYGQMLGDPAHAHLEVVRCRVPVEAERWLRSLDHLG